MTVLVTGGSGSGKSALAEQISERLRQPEKPFYYLATMQVWDAECEARIAKHRQQRAGKGFCTIEMKRPRLSHQGAPRCWNVSAI